MRSRARGPAVRPWARGPVAVMTLRACERRALRKIETELCRTDPRLRSLFSMFARLTPDTTAASGPENLGAEKARQARCRPARSRMRAVTSPARLRLILFMVVALLTVTCAMFLGGDPGAARCRPAVLQRSVPVAARGWPVPMGHRLVVPGVPVPAAPAVRASCPAGNSQTGQMPITQP